jgi:UDP-N-acetylglucosamine:LPS N-acetylglucosamine transferase
MAHPPILLVCSPGGHLQQLQALRPAWDGPPRVWVTLPSADVSDVLSGETFVLGHGPTNRSVRNFVRNLRVAWRVVRAERPQAILSTGAALAVPFFIVGRMHGCRLVYVESLTRTRTLSLTGRLVTPLAHDFFVQWPTTRRPKRARYVGSIL